tara:strand:+ start:2527 stop:3060 length:534 start_codon:yes stop_codon:yes gene_type:complete
MKKLKYVILIVGIILISGYLYISLTPPVSPFEVVSYKKDTLQFEVQYSRPFKKDRIIFGSEPEALVPYGEYWRLGANSATTFETNKEMNFGGEKIQAGKYRMFAIPDKEKWKVVLNSESGKFGYFEPNYEKNIISVNISTQPLLNSLEQFTISFEENENGLFLILKWDKTSVTITLI